MTVSTNNFVKQFYENDTAQFRNVNELILQWVQLKCDTLKDIHSLYFKCIYQGEENCL